MKLRIGLAVLFSVSVLSLRPVGAWGTDGHHIVARIAWPQMTEQARQQATALLGGDDFVQSSTWADEVRRQRPETYNWHFVNIPYGANSYDSQRDCKATPQGDCVIAEIERDQRVIGNMSAAIGARKDALKFLIHFVGDLHQPLHSIDNSDRGGNDVSLLLDGRQTNLHAVWDSGIISTKGIGEAAYADALLADLKSHPVPDEALNVTAWAMAAHAVGVKFVYTYVGFSPQGPPKEPIRFVLENETKQIPVVERQLQLAGARLARLLNAALR